MRGCIQLLLYTQNNKCMCHMRMCKYWRRDERIHNLEYQPSVFSQLRIYVKNESERALGNVFGEKYGNMCLFDQYNKTYSLRRAQQFLLYPKRRKFCIFNILREFIKEQSLTHAQHFQIESSLNNSLKKVPFADI